MYLKKIKMIIEITTKKGKTVITGNALDVNNAFSIYCKNEEKRNREKKTKNKKKTK